MMLRFFWSFIFCLLVATHTVAGTNLTLSEIPPCSLQCLVKGFGKSGCGLLDTHCQCTSQVLFDITSECVLDGCSKSDGIILSQYQAQLCQKKDQSRAGELLGFIYGGLVIAFGSFILRMASRWAVHRKLFLDDYMVLVAMALTIGLTGTSTLMVASGFGQHIYQIHIDKVSEILFLVWFSESMYALFLVFIKLALVLFFLRIFPQRWFKIACHILIVLIIALGLMWVLLLIFQCHHIQGNWNINIAKPQCIDLQAVAYAAAGINIIQDLAIMILPVPLLLNVRVGMKRKLALLSMFSVGIFVIATSCARIGSISKFSRTADATWDDVNITVWTTLEIDIALFCCNMPAISALVSHLRRRNQETKASKGNTYGGNTAAELLPTNTPLAGTSEKKGANKFGFSFFKSTTNKSVANQDDMTLELVKESSSSGNESSRTRKESSGSEKGLPPPPPSDYLSVAKTYGLSWSPQNAQDTVQVSTAMPYEGPRTRVVTVISSERDLESGRWHWRMDSLDT